MRKIFLSIFLMAIPIFFSIIGSSSAYGNSSNSMITNEAAEIEDQQKIEGYDILKEKMLPKCLEFKAADTLDMLKNEDPDLFLMCMEFIIDGY